MNVYDSNMTLWTFMGIYSTVLKFGDGKIFSRSPRLHLYEKIQLKKNNIMK